MPPMKSMVLDSSRAIDTFTKKGRPVWKRVRPIQYAISERENLRNSLFLKVLIRLFMALDSLGFASTKSFSLSLKTGMSIQTRAMMARAMNQMR